MKDKIFILLQYLFSLLPLCKKKIIIIGYYGSQYGCSPKYLSKSIVATHPDWDVVWAFVNPDYHDINHVRKVKLNSVRYFYELCTSKVLITNYRMTSLYHKRKGQYYMMTWHSSLRLKAIEGDVESTLPPHYVRMAKEDSKKIDALLSGCQFSDEIFKRAFWYDGEILKSGTPRIDLFYSPYSNEISHTIKQQLNLNPNHKLILYAPTFRNDNNLDYYRINFNDLAMSIKLHSGDDCTILVRLHPHLKPYSSELQYGEHAIDVTSYDDIQELLLISDILITDYSSLMFDFAETKRPCFLYTPDLDKYQAKERKLYFKIEELPFILCKTQDELKANIISFNKHQYETELQNFMTKIGSYEDGNSCKRVIKHLELWIQQKK